MELECQLSSLRQLDTKSCLSVFSPGMSVPHMSDDSLQQNVSEASAAAKNRASSV